MRVDTDSMGAAMDLKQQAELDKQADNVRPRVDMPADLATAIAMAKHKAHAAVLAATGGNQDHITYAVIEVLIHRALVVDNNPDATAARAIAFWQDVAKVFGS